MKKTTGRCVAGLMALALCYLAWAGETPVGVWRTYDDGDGLPASLVQIEERNGTLEGRVVGANTHPLYGGLGEGFRGTVEEVVPCAAAGFARFGPSLARRTAS